MSKLTSVTLIIRFSCLLAVLGAGFVAPTAPAIEVAGVAVPPTATLSNGTVLILNGAGVRKKFLVKVYVGALYLPSRTPDPDAILASEQANRVELHILYKAISRDKLVKAWSERFEANLSPETLSILEEKIKRFNSLFHSVKKGDVITVDFLPTTGTEISVNGHTLGVIPGREFNQAVLSIWLGKKPVSKPLKQSMLYGD